MKRTRYLQQDKQLYMKICQEYNHAEANAEQDPKSFICWSIRLCIAKTTVPKSWHAASFVARVGLPA